MANTIDYWYNLILTTKAGKPELDVLTNTSKTARVNLMAYIVAVVIWTLDQLFDFHKTEVNDIIATKKPHGLKWYRDKALLFQNGMNLITDSDQYNNTGLSDADITAKKIVKYAAVTEIDGKLRIKTAKEVSSELAPLTAGELLSFSTYMAIIKDAGVKVICDSLPADNLKLTIDVWFNALVLKSDGSRIDGAAATPVKDAIKAYLKTLPFNGEYSNTSLTDYLQTVDGVQKPVIRSAQAKYGLFPFSSIDEIYIPDAGYLRIEDVDLTINYRQYV